MGIAASRRISEEIAATVDSGFDFETVLDDEDVLLFSAIISLREH